MESRNSFVFYRSFFEAADKLKIREKAAVMSAICEYALNGREPQLSGAAEAVFILIKPQLDANQLRYEAGKKGGRKKTKDNQTETKSEPNENVNVNDNGNDNDNENGTAGSDGSVSGVCVPQQREIFAYVQKIKPGIAGNAELQAFLSQGVSERMVRWAVDTAADKGKGWSYARGILENMVKAGKLDIPAPKPSMVGWNSGWEPSYDIDELERRGLNPVYDEINSPF